VYPDEIEFLDVRPNQTYIQTVEIKNKLHSTCSFRMRPSNAERITIEPSTLSLAPGETKRVQVKFKLQGKPLPKKKGGAAYRDTVQLKSDFFEKKFVVSFQPSGPPEGTREDKENLDSSAFPLGTHHSSTRSSSRSTQLGVSTVGKTSMTTTRLSRAETINRDSRNTRSHSLDRSRQQPKAAAFICESYEEHIKQLRAEHTSELHSRHMQAEKLRARLERALTEVEEWRRVANECEVHRRRSAELGEMQAHLQERLQEVQEREVMLDQQATHLQMLKQQLELDAPDLRRISDMLGVRDREEREERDAKVLRVLRTKDEKIAVLHGKLQGLEQVLDETRTKLISSEHALQDLHKQADRTSRERNDAVASLQLKWREEQEEVLRLRAKVEDMQLKLVETNALQRQIAEMHREKARLEAEVQGLLQQSSSVQQRCVALEEKAETSDRKDREIAQLQIQVQQQSDQLDALVAQLGGGAGQQEAEIAELRRQISELRAANARLDARRLDAERVFQDQLQRLSTEREEGRVGDDGAEALRVKVVQLQAALELAQKSIARSSVQSLGENSKEISDKDKQISELRAAKAELEAALQRQQQPFPVHAGTGPPHSPDSLTNTITLVESDVDSAGGSIKEGRNTAQDQAISKSSERELQDKLAEASVRESKLRAQLSRLERIQKSAQGTALAQERQLHRAVHAIGQSSETLEQTAAGLSLEVEQWRAKAEAASKDAAKYKAKADEAMAHLSQYDAAVSTLEKELKECKETLSLYHDRIVALAGPEDKAVQGYSKWSDKSKSGMLPLSSHLKATNKLGQQYAAEKRQLERSMAISAKALDAVRAELVQCQALRTQENHQWELRVHELGAALSEFQQRLRLQRDDGVIRIQELERSVRLLSTKSDVHKSMAAVTQEVVALRVEEQRLKNELNFFRSRASDAERENKASMERVVALQCRLNSVQFAPAGSDQLVTTMSEQIEAQEAEVERLEGLLRAAKEEHDGQVAAAENMRANHEEQLSATRLVAEAHERRVHELQKDVQALEDATRKSYDTATDSHGLVQRAQAEKAAADKLVQTLRDELAQTEEKLVKTRAEVADRVHAISSKHSEEQQLLAQQLGESRRACLRLELERSQLEAQVANCGDRTESLSKQLQEAQDEREQALAEARQAQTRARQAQDQAARENERLQHNLSSSSAQLAVLMDTIETLQGTTTQQQRVASLSTKLCAAQASELQLQLCNSQLHLDLQDRVWQINQLEAQTISLQQQLSSATRKLSSTQQVQQLDAREMHALKADIADRDQQLDQAQATQEQQQRRIGELVVEVQTYRKSLEEQRERHTAHVKELCAQAEEEEQRQRARALSAQGHEQVLAAQQGLVEMVIDKLLVANATASKATIAASMSDEMSSHVRERISAAMSEMSVQTTHLVRSKMVMEWQLAVKDRKIAALWAVLDASLEAQSLAENRCLALDDYNRTQRAAEDCHAWSRVEALQHRAAVLGQQVEQTNKHVIELSVALSQSQQDRDAATSALEALQRKQHALAADHDEKIAQLSQSMREDAAKKAELFDQELRDFVRTEVLALLTTDDEGEQAQVLALSEELCLQQAKHDVFLESLSSMQQRHDVLRRQLTASREALDRAEARLAEVPQKFVAKPVLPASVMSIEDLMLQRDGERAKVSQLTFDVQVLRRELDDARDEVLAERLAREKAEDRDHRAAEALRMFRVAQDDAIAARKAMLQEDLRRADSELKAHLKTLETRRQEELDAAREELATLKLQNQQEQQNKCCPSVLDATVQTNLEHQDWIAKEEKWCGRERSLDNDIMMLEAQVNALKGETVALQDQLDDKNAAFHALELAMAQAASRENARAGGAAEALSKSLVAAKVENSEVKRKLRKAEEAEKELRIQIRQLLANRRLPSPSKAPHASNSVRGSLSSLRASGNEDHVFGEGMGAAVAETQRELMAMEVSTCGGENCLEQQCQTLEKCLERSLRLQNEAEAEMLSHVTGLVRAVAVTARAPHQSSSEGRLQLSSAAGDVEQRLTALTEILNDQLRKKRTFVSSLNSSALPQPNQSVGCHIVAAATALVNKQMDSMCKHRDSLAAVLPTLHPNNALNPASSASKPSASRSLSPSKSRMAPKGAIAGGVNGRRIKEETVKIKDPHSARLQRDIKELRSKLIDQSSKHAIEMDKMKKQLKLSEARSRQLSEAQVSLAMPKAEEKVEESLGSKQELDSTMYDQQVANTEQLRARCQELEQSLLVREAEAASERQQRLAMHQQLQAMMHKPFTDTTLDPPASAPAVLASPGKSPSISKHRFQSEADETTSQHRKDPSKLEEELRCRVQTLETKVRELTSQLKSAQHAAQLTSSCHSTMRSQRQEEQDGSSNRETGVDNELEQAATSLVALDLTNSIQHTAQRRLHQAHDELQALHVSLDRQRMEAEQRVDEVRAYMQEQQAMLEEKYSVLLQEREAAGAALRDAEAKATMLEDSANERKQELIEAVSDINQLRKAQDRERTRHSEVLHERDAVIRQLQDAVHRLEADAVDRRSSEKDYERLQSERDKALSELNELRSQHQHSMQTLRAEINRTNSEYQMLDHERKHVIEQLKAKLLSVEAQLFRSEKEGREAQEGIVDNVGRRRVLPPPTSPETQSEERTDQAYNHLLASPDSSHVSPGTAEGRQGQEQAAGRMVEILLAELQETRRLLEEHQEQQRRADADREQVAGQLAGQAEQQAELERVRAALLEQETTAVQVRNLNARLTSQILELSSSHASLQASKETYEQDMARLSLALQEQERDKDEMARQVDQLRAQASGAKTEAAKAAQQIERLQRQLEVQKDWVKPGQVREQLSAAKQEASALKDQLKTCKEDVARKVSILGTLKKERQNVDDRLQALTRDNEQLEKKLERAVQDVKSKDFALKALKEKQSKTERVALVDANSSSHSYDSAKLHDKIRSLSSDVGRKDDLIKELRAKMQPLHEVEQALQAKEEQLAAANLALKKARADIERKDLSASSAKARALAATQERDGLNESVKTLEASLLKAQKLLASKSAEMATMAVRSSALDESIRSLGSSLLAQVEGLLTRLRLNGGGTSEKSSDLRASAGARRMQDGQRILEMSLTSPIDVEQLRDSLLRFVEERVRLELLTVQSKASSDSQSKIQLSHRAPNWLPAEAPLDGAAEVEGSANARSFVLPPQSSSFSHPNAEVGASSSPPSLSSPKTSKTTATAPPSQGAIVRQSGGNIASKSSGGGVSEEGAGTASLARGGSLLSRATVQAQVDEIQQRLGLFVRAPPISGKPVL
jgi:chromosome segregation ATPase